MGSRGMSRNHCGDIMSPRARRLNWPTAFAAGAAAAIVGGVVAWPVLRPEMRTGHRSIPFAGPAECGVHANWIIGADCSSRRVHQTGA